MEEQSTTQQEQQQREAEIKISRRISGFFLGLIGLFSLVAAVAYIALSPSDQQPVAAAPTAQAVTVAMRDPGCHWFQVGQSFQKSLSVAGPVNLVNSDEAALKVAGPGGTQKDAVGQQVALTPGSYRITMVGQAPDDNTLHLAVD